MMKKNILVFEDDGAALAFANALAKSSKASELLLTSYSWTDVEYWLNESPGASTFAALVFDLKLPYEKLRQYNNIEYNEDIFGSPAHYFIENYIRPNHSELLDRIIIFSAYIDDVRPKWPNIDDYIVINKLDGGSVAKLLNKVGRLM